MKTIITLILSVSILSYAHASDTLYYYLGEKFERVNQTDAHYIRKALRMKEGEWMTFDYTISNKLIALRYFTDTNFEMKLNCHYYYDTLKMYRRGITCFKDGKKEGITAGFNEHGDTLWTTTFSNDNPIAQKKFPGFIAPGENESTPRFPGGLQGWQKFLNKNLRYPRKAIDQKIQGTVVVSFFVSEEGKLSDFKVEKSVHPSLDEEVIRILKSGPNWLPAERDGKKVGMRREQPMVFRLE